MLKLNGNIGLYGLWKLDPKNGPASIPNIPDGPPPEEADFNVTQSGSAFQLNTPTGPNVRDGKSLAIFNDTLIIGTPNFTNAGVANSGRAHIWQYNGTTWVMNPSTQLASPGAGDSLFGFSVAIYNDWIAVGSPRAPTGGSTAPGVVYLYKANAGVWSTTPTTNVQETGVSGSNFGSAVDMYGSTLVVGAKLGTASSIICGQVYVYTTDGATWTKQATLNADDNLVSGQEFGAAASIYGDTLVVGAPKENSNTGAVYVFTRSGSTWTKRARLVPTNPIAGGQFGNAVKVIDGKILVGAPGAENESITPTSSQSAAYLFSGSGSTWIQEQVFEVSATTGNGTLLVDPNYGAGAMGQGLDITADGKTVIVGAYKAAANTRPQCGAIYVFEKVNNVWGPSAIENATSSLRVSSSLADNEWFGYQAKFHKDQAVVGTTPGRRGSTAVLQGRGGFVYFK